MENEYCIVVDGVIENIILATENVAEQLGAFSCYDGAKIGDKYSPPRTPTMDERIADLEAQNKALTASNQFLEDCLVEMATIVYA